VNLNSRIFSRCFSYDFLPQQAKSWRFVFSWLRVGLLVCVCSRLSTGQIGIITTIAGGGPHNVPATSAHLHNPTDVATDLQGNVYVVTSGQDEVFRVDRDTGILTDAAGSDSNGFSGDGGPATLASMNGPYGLAIDMARNLFIADSFNDRIRRVDAITHLVTTYAGGGVPCAGRVDGFGDGCSATDATLSFPSGVAVDRSGNLLIADIGHNLIRRVDAVTGVITPFFAGSHPSGVSVDSNGNVFIADTGNRRVVKIDVAANTLSIVAGGGPLCASRTDSVGDGCLATNARLNGPVSD
jgi:sugar lactone lactonase YvrE